MGPGDVEGDELPPVPDFYRDMTGALSNECERLRQQLALVEKMNAGNAKMRMEYMKERDIALLHNDELGKQLSVQLGQIQSLELRNRDLWWLLENEPSGPGEGMVSSAEDVKLQREWAEKYEMVRAGLPIHQDAGKPKCVHDGGAVPCDHQKPCPDHTCACGKAAVTNPGDKCLRCMSTEKRVDGLQIDNTGDRIADGRPVSEPIRRPGEKVLVPGLPMKEATIVSIDSNDWVTVRYPDGGELRWKRWELKDYA